MFSAASFLFFITDKNKTLLKNRRQLIPKGKALIFRFLRDEIRRIVWSNMPFDYNKRIKLLGIRPICLSSNVFLQHCKKKFRIPKNIENKCKEICMMNYFNELLQFLCHFNFQLKSSNKICLVYARVIRISFQLMFTAKKKILKRSF